MPSGSDARAALVLVLSFAQLGEELELEAVGRMLVVELFAMACCDDWGGERQSRKTRPLAAAARSAL